MNNKNIKYIVASIVLVVIAVALLKFEVFPGKKTNNIVVSKAIYVDNFSDNRVLAGSADNIFVGKVIRQMGNKSNRPWRGAEGQFETKVIMNIKGNLEGSVIVDQIGGYKDGKFYMQGLDFAVGNMSKPEDYVLNPGSTYLFASRQDDQENWQIVSIPGLSWQIISSDSDISEVQLLQIIKSSDSVLALKEAYINEIHTRADISHGRNTNAFNSLPVNEQEKIKAEVAQMKEEASQPTTNEPIVIQEVTPEPPAVVQDTVPEVVATTTEPQ
jgi:hypothetical protein